MMSNHLTDKELNGYIHRTLTDVQRETMGRHLSRCERCRGWLQEAEGVQSQISNELGMELRYTRPSTHMRFAQIQKGIQRKRKFAFLRFHAWRITGTVGKFALAILGIAFAMTMFSLAGQGEPLVQANPAPAMFAEPWETSAPYEAGLITSEQTALASLDTAPIYHLDVTIDEGLQRVFGRQQLRYVNTTGKSITELYFSLFPNLTDGRLHVSGILVDGDPVHYEIIDDLFLRIALPYRLRTAQTAVVQIEFRLDVGHTQDEFHGGLANINDTLSLIHFHPQLVPYNIGTGWDLSLPRNGNINSNNSYYRVRVTAPDTIKIITSGSMREETVMENGLSTRLFSAGPVASFYLIASEEFNVHLSKTVGETTINSYATIAYWQEDAQMALDVATEAVRVSNEQFGTYPFTELDIVGSSTLGVNARDMDFPGVLVVTFPYGREGVAESVVSQVSGQWFRPIVAQSYQQNPWLADGLATYATHYYYDAMDGYTAVDDLQTKWQQSWNEQQGWNTAKIESPTMSLDKLTKADFAQAMYDHTPLFLSWLSQMVGEMTFADFLQDYYHTYRWTGASAVQFADMLANHCACDVSPFFAVPTTSPTQPEILSGNNRD